MIMVEEPEQIALGLTDVIVIFAVGVARTVIVTSLVETHGELVIVQRNV
jgi:hypothetical protein